MSGEMDINELLKNLNPVLNEGEYIFCTVSSELKDLGFTPLATFHEKEGLSVVVDKEMADKHSLTYESTFSCITLEVHSSLDAVGLTAACSTALATQGISCNMIAATYHDHIFVNVRDAERALVVLESLS